MSLSFVNLDAEVKFSVRLQLPQSYPLGRVDHTAKIWFGGTLAASSSLDSGGTCVSARLLAGPLTACPGDAEQVAAAQLAPSLGCGSADGGQVNEQRIAQAVEAAPHEPGRLRSICQQLRCGTVGGGEAAAGAIFATSPSCRAALTGC